jgi:translation initiation factor 1A
MPNKKGGRNYKRGKKTIHVQKELIIKETDNFEEYGFVKQKLGNGRFTIICQDGLSRLGIISGKMRKRVWLEINDYVLITIWDYQTEKCSIIHKYEQQDVQKLIEKHELNKEFVKQLVDDSLIESSYDDSSISSSDESSEEEEIDESWVKKEKDININDI